MIRRTRESKGVILAIGLLRGRGRGKPFYMRPARVRTRDRVVKGSLFAAPLRRGSREEGLMEWRVGIGKSRKSRIFIAVRLVFIGFYVVFEVEKQFWTIGWILVLPR